MSIPVNTPEALGHAVRTARKQLGLRPVWFDEPG